MKRVVMLACSIALAAAGSPCPASAQIAGMPLWNSPKGGTGLTISGDLGFPDSTGGKGTTYAGRVDLGLQALSLSATVGGRNPKGPGSTVAEYGGAAAFRLIGGSLLPVAVNLQGGFGRFRDSSVTHTRFTGALGFAVSVPTPSLDIEPWVAPGFRVSRKGASGPISSSTDTNFGIAGGVNLGLGLMGVHAGFDYEKLKGGGHTTTFGVGAHVGLRAPIGM